MKFSKVHCLFEQSGTFKKAFEKLGYVTLDYDIVETSSVDVNVDLFAEIDNCFNKSDKSIFDNINSGDLVFAFFPCTFFSDQSQLISRGDNYGMRNFSIQEKLINSSTNMYNRAVFYQKLCMLCTIAINKRFKLIIENPYGNNRFLNKFFPLKPQLIIKDRRDYGDFFRKPTQFFFINCEPEFHLENYVLVQKKDYPRVESFEGLNRSLISNEFAENFIKTFVDE